MCLLSCYLPFSLPQQSLFFHYHPSNNFKTSTSLLPKSAGAFFMEKKIYDRPSTNLPGRVIQLRMGGTAKAVAYNGEKCRNTAFQKLFSDFSIFLVRIPSLAALIIVKRFNLNCSLHSCRTFWKKGIVQPEDS